MRKLFAPNHTLLGLFVNTGLISALTDFIPFLISIARMSDKLLLHSFVH